MNRKVRVVVERERGEDNDGDDDFDNDDIGKASVEIEAILTAERLRRRRQVGLTDFVRGLTKAL